MFDDVSAQLRPDQRYANFYQGSICLSQDDARLLDLFSQEIKAAAAACATLLSCFNAAEYGANVTLPIGAAHMAPQHPASFADVAQSGLKRLLSPATLSCLKGLAGCLIRSREAFEHILRAQQATGPVRIEACAGIADALNTAACFIKLVLQDLISIEARLLRELEVAEMKYLASLLDDVLEGKSPLLANGRLVPLRTDFHVRDMRVELNADAIMLDGDQSVRVIVCNISPGGLGFKAASQFEIGKAITVRLVQSGREFSGRLVWKIGDAAGISFFERLSDRDPMLVAQ
jgi:PilZ domain